MTSNCFGSYWLPLHLLSIQWKSMVTNILQNIFLYIFLSCHYKTLDVQNIYMSESEVALTENSQSLKEFLFSIDVKIWRPPVTLTDYTEGDLLQFITVNPRPVQVVVFCNAFDCTQVSITKRESLDLMHLRSTTPQKRASERYCCLNLLIKWTEFEIWSFHIKSNNAQSLAYCLLCIHQMKTASIGS